MKVRVLGCSGAIAQGCKTTSFLVDQDMLIDAGTGVGDLSRDEMLREVWGWSTGDASTVTVHIRRLREKIEADPRDPVYLRTQWGTGYRFTPSGRSS